jgi:hypothetical protein
MTARFGACSVTHCLAASPAVLTLQGLSYFLGAGGRPNVARVRRGNLEFFPMTGLAPGRHAGGAGTGDTSTAHLPLPCIAKNTPVIPHGQSSKSVLFLWSCRRPALPGIGQLSRDEEKMARTLLVLFYGRLQICYMQPIGGFASGIVLTTPAPVADP